MYYAPAGQCVIVSPSKDVEWTLCAATAYDTSVLVNKVYPFLTGITVTVEANLVSAIQVTFDAPFDEGILMLHENANGASPFNTGNLIRVRVGYADMNSWTPWYYGMLQQGGDGVSISPEGVNGTISAQMNNWQQGYVPENGASTATGAMVLLNQLVTAMGMTLEVGPGAGEVLDRVDKTRKDMCWATLGKTSIETLKRICTVWGLVGMPSFKADGSPDVFKVYGMVEVDRGDAMGGAQRNTYVMRGAFSPQTKQYPIMSWGPEAGLASWLGTTARGSNSGVGMRGVNKMTGTVVSVNCTPEDILEPLFVGQASAKGAPVHRTWDGKILDVAVQETGVPLPQVFGASGSMLTPELYAPPVPPVKEDAQAAEDMKQQGTAKMADGNQAQQATLTTLGVPDQEVLALINVRGCSARYDGPYKVMGLTHRWSSGSYEMDMKVLRTGTIGMEDPGGVPTAGSQVPQEG